MFNEFIKKSQQLHDANKAFAIAFVVNRTIPSSGKPGDKAIIEPDGTITGWIGGGCTRGIVLKEASLAIKEGKPRMVRISPDNNDAPKPCVVDYKMTCQSGGAVELYIEPVLPRPHLVIMGKSHVAMALARLAKAMSYKVSVFANNSDFATFPDVDDLLEHNNIGSHLQANSFIVVCTQGENDEDALEQAALSGSEYVAFVSSRKKASAIFHTLRKRGVGMEQLKTIRTPAGLDIKAKLPEEVAISILAEIIATIRSKKESDKAESVDALAANEAIYINPVCGVPVEKKTAKHVLTYEGQQVYFCCDGCKVSFEREPEKYMTA